MTPRAPAFDEIEKFLKIDGWAEVTGSSGHGTSHRVFERVLEGGQVLTTHISHSGSGPESLPSCCTRLACRPTSYTA
jgi:hypothetical protein